MEGFKFEIFEEYEEGPILEPLDDDDPIIIIACCCCGGGGDNWKIFSTKPNP